MKRGRWGLLEAGPREGHREEWGRNRLKIASTENESQTTKVQLSSGRYFFK